jgi:hypothetical protein
VIGQTALSLLLLACGGLFLMSAIGAASADPGFRLERGLLAEIDPSLAGYDDERARRFHLDVVERLRAVAGVEAVTVGSSFPFTEFGDSRLVARAGESAVPVDAGFMAIGRDYARTLGLRVLSGRDFTAAELSSGASGVSSASEHVAIIDDVLARRLWPDESAVGQLIQTMDERGAASGAPMRVVGMVSAVNESLGNPNPSPHLYVPLGQNPASAMTLQLRARHPRSRRARARASPRNLARAARRQR